MFKWLKRLFTKNKKVQFSVIRHNEFIFHPAFPRGTLGEPFDMMDFKLEIKHGRYFCEHPAFTEVTKDRTKADPDTVLVAFVYSAFKEPYVKYLSNCLFVGERYVALPSKDTIAHAWSQFIKNKEF